MLNSWTDFFVLMGGAAATLTGLIFVGVSISLSKILAWVSLPARAAQALVLLLTVLLISCVNLIPGQSIAVLGIEVLFIGLGIWIISTRTDWKILTHTENNTKNYS